MQENLSSRKFQKNYEEILKAMMTFLKKILYMDILENYYGNATDIIQICTGQIYYENVTENFERFSSIPMIIFLVLVATILPITVIYFSLKFRHASS